MTRSEALSIWGLLAGATAGRDLDEQNLAIRAELILDLDFAAARPAAIHLARVSDWLPSVAQVRQAVLRPDPVDAGTAWGEVCQVVGRLGWTTPPTAADFSDPLILDAVRALGTWQDFCHGEEAINRAHFLRLFPALADRARRTAIGGDDPTHALPAANPAGVLDLRLDR